MEVMASLARLIEFVVLRIFSGISLFIPMEKKPKGILK